MNQTYHSPTPSLEKKHLLPQLFLATLCLSAFTFGGGYVIITLMKKKFVDEYHWIDQKEILDLTAIAQSCPGPVAVNGAIVIGFKLAGLSGVLTAVCATVLPPFAILSLISLFYEAFRSYAAIGWMLNGMQAGVGAVIAQTVWEMGSKIVKEKKWGQVFIMAAAFGANLFFHVNVILIILICALLGAVQTFLQQNKNMEGGGK